MSATAILIFARTGRRDSQQKIISNSRSRNAGLFDALNKKVIALAENTKLPFYVIDESNQVGSSFCERITNAVDYVFDFGYDNILIIGNDCPQLNTAKLKKAANLLQNNPLIIGPDYNGGAYLIGIDKCVFNKDIFENIRWQTKFVSVDLTQFCTPVMLARLHDLNRIESAKKVIELLNVKSNIRQFILNVIPGYLFKVPTILNEYKSIDIATYFLLRGPPISA
jgi:hypothetical protein